MQVHVLVDVPILRRLAHATARGQVHRVRFRLSHRPVQLRVSVRAVRRVGREVGAEMSWRRPVFTCGGARDAADGLVTLPPGMRPAGLIATPYPHNA